MLVLPKSSSYTYKNDDERTVLRNTVLKWYEWCKDNELQVICFAEDMLAVELLGDKEISWMSVLSENDKNFLLKFVDNYPEKYKELNTTTCREEFIQAAMSKVKSKKLSEFGGDEVRYLENRMAELQSRLSFTASKVMESRKALIQLRDNNNFTKMIEPVGGDGKAIVVVDLKWGVETCYYGGIPLEKAVFEDIVRSV